MKIAIQSYPKNYNYGWILQLYALKTQLDHMGHETIIIDIRRPLYKNIWKLPLQIIKRGIKKWILRKEDIHLLQEIYIQKKDKDRGRKFDEFFFKYLTPRTPILITKKELKTVNGYDFNAIVVGSDQVWRSKFHQNIENNYLSYITNPNIKKISYAASFGVENKEYTPKEIIKCGKAIAAFHGVSVREASGINLIKEIYKWECIQPIHHIDPTFFLDANDYSKLIDQANTTPTNGDLFCYVLDNSEDKEKCIEKLCKNSKWKPYSISIKEELPSVEQWLRSFRDAKFIFTDSFHGCVFSIIFRKPFLVYGNEKRGLTRFTSVLKKFGLEKHLILKSEDFCAEKEIRLDLKIISDRVLFEQKRSIDYLTDLFKS